MVLSQRWQKDSLFSVWLHTEDSVEDPRGEQETLPPFHAGHCLCGGGERAEGHPLKVSAKDARDGRRLPKPFLGLDGICDTEQIL